MDIFEKCYAPSLANELQEKGIYPYFHALQSRQDVEVMMEGKRRIMLGSNNYLGLTTDPQVMEAGIKALEQFGTGCSGSRFLNGTLQLHLELEEELARFLHKEAVITFGTGFQSNVGIISALVGRHDYVICDRENHASIYAGCQMSYGKMLRYRHSDMEDLEKQLARVPEQNGTLIVTDGVFSMGGDIAKAPGNLRPGQEVRRPRHGGRCPRPGRAGQWRPRHRKLLWAGGSGGCVYGHLLQVPGLPGRLHGGLRGGGGVCAPRLPSVYLLRIHSSCQLRHSPGSPAASWSSIRSCRSGCGS